MGGEGAYIALESGEAGGKGTQIPIITSHLEELGYEVLSVREPGSTPLAEHLRKVIKEKDFQASIGFKPSNEDMAWLFSTARQSLIREQIGPFFEENSEGIVISDRSLRSTEVYQGFVGGMSYDQIEDMQHYAIGDTRPDLVIILDIPVEEIVRRQAKDDSEVRIKDFFDNKKADFHQRVREGYLYHAKLNPDTDVVVNGVGTIEEVSSRVIATIDDFLGI